MIEYNAHTYSIQLTIAYLLQCPNTLSANVTHNYSYLFIATTRVGRVLYNMFEKQLNCYISWTRWRSRDKNFKLRKSINKYKNRYQILSHDPSRISPLANKRWNPAKYFPTTHQELAVVAIIQLLTFVQFYHMDTPNLFEHRPQCHPPCSTKRTIWPTMVGSFQC